MAALEADEKAARVDADVVGSVGALLYRRAPALGRATSAWAYLANLYVLPQHRGRGAGRALVDAVLTWAQSLQLDRVVLSPSRRSVPLYRRAGFVPANELLVRRVRGSRREKPAGALLGGGPTSSGSVASGPTDWRP